MLHGRIDGTHRLIPLPLMGNGMARLANLAIYIANAPNGIVLVDEVENGLHYSVMSSVWKIIALAARQSNTQIFATTHSWECIQAAHEAFASEETYDFRLHRLGWVNGEIKSVTYDKGSLAASLKHELEVR
jgi:AAA15 family ATPase/GTPase